MLALKVPLSSIVERLKLLKGTRYNFNRVLLSVSLVQLPHGVRNGVAEHNVTVARALTKLKGAFVTFWDNDPGSKIHL